MTTASSHLQVRPVQPAQTWRCESTIILPDYGWNMGGDFKPNESIYEYMEQVVPQASYVRAKIYKIDSGREEYIDYERVIDILKSTNYNGAVSVVYEGQPYSDCDDYEAIRLGVSHLRKLLAAG